MSLTNHLKDAGSPVRQFIYSCAPELALAGTRGAVGREVAERCGFDELTSLETRIPIPAEVKPTQRKSHAITAGIALDYRIRFDLPGFDITETAAKKGLDRFALNPGVVHRGKHIEHVLREAAMGLAYLTLKEPDPHPLSLARASVPLAWCEAIHRAGPVTALTGDLGRQIKRAKDGAELMMRIDDSLLFDIASMHGPICELLAEWSRAAAEGTPYEPNPTFLGSPAVGGADGDLAIGDLLVDIKTREEVTNPWLREALCQLLGYALLDLDDAHGIRRVGIMLPRQTHLHVWSLDELLAADAEETLPVLRDELASILIGMVNAEPVGSGSSAAEDG